jgi:hypothetical protein
VNNQNRHWTKYERRYDLAMRLSSLSLLSFVLVATAQSVTDSVRRVDYPQENFSLAVPATWTEIEPSVLAAAPAAIRQAAPNAPEIRIRHGFKASATPGPSYPWIALIITEDPIDEMMFENMEWAHRTVDELSKKWQSAGGTLERARMNNMSYDKSRHLLWGISQSTFSGVGDLSTLSGVYLTTTGTIQVHCYSKASDFIKDQPLCKEIIESVIIAPKIAIAVSPATVPAGGGLNGTDYQTLVRRVEAGDLTIDFRALRLACMKSSQCEPRGTKADLGAMNQAARDHQLVKVVEIAERLIRQGFVNIEVHATCVKAYEELHESAKSKFHMDVTAALLRSILFSGDGRTKESAYEVISDREEYSTLVAKGLPYAAPGVSVSAIEEGGHRYDKWEVADPKTGQTVVIFFNTDAFSSKSRAGAN